MPRIVTVHSFLRGTGKSSLTANIAALLAGAGLRVAVIDADLASPALHSLFGLELGAGSLSFNDYIQGKCKIVDAVRLVEPRVDWPPTGSIFVIPASSSEPEIVRVLREGHKLDQLSRDLQGLHAELALDVVMIDAPSGLSETTLSLLALADTVIMVLRLDKQDYQGTAVTLDVARKLGVPHLLLVVNPVPLGYDLAEVAVRVEATYACDVAAVLPYADEMATSGSSIFVWRYPNHPNTASLRKVGSRLAP